MRATFWIGVLAGGCPGPQPAWVAATESRSGNCPKKRAPLSVRARIAIAGLEKESVVEPGRQGLVFEINLPAGKTKLMTYLVDENGNAGGVYFTDVEAL